MSDFSFTQYDPYGEKREIFDLRPNEEKKLEFKNHFLQESKNKPLDTITHIKPNENFDGEHDAMMLGIVSKRAMQAAEERLKIRRAAKTIDGSAVRVIDDSTFPVHSLGKFGLYPEVTPVVLSQEDLGIKVVGGTREDFIALGRALESQIATEKAIEDSGSIPLMGGEHSV
jgi:hypothetical protein